MLLRHVPPTGDEASGTQHLQVCDGSILPNGDPDRVYLVRTNGLLGYEMFDVTDPAEPRFLLTIASTGVSSRPESSRGNRETHKLQWECESGIGYFNGRAGAVSASSGPGPKNAAPIAPALLARKSRRSIRRLLAMS